MKIITEDIFVPYIENLEIDLEGILWEKTVMATDDYCQLIISPLDNEEYQYVKDTLEGHDIDYQGIVELDENPL